MGSFNERYSIVGREAPHEPDFDVLTKLPVERDTQDLNVIVELLTERAAPLIARYSSDQVLEVARRGRLCSLQAGVVVVSAHEEPSYFFIVLSGNVVVDEPAVHHQEEINAPPVHQQSRERLLSPGHAFHHLPLVTRSRSFGYDAKVVDDAPAALIVINAADWLAIFGVSVESELRATVKMLSSTDFFVAWTDAALQRLFFWFEKRKVRSGVDIVHKGDDANFCFIIARGTCDILVPDDTSGRPPAIIAHSPSASSSAFASPAILARRTTGAVLLTRRASAQPPGLKSVVDAAQVFRERQMARRRSTTSSSGMDGRRRSMSSSSEMDGLSPSLSRQASGAAVASRRTSATPSPISTSPRFRPSTPDSNSGSLDGAPDAAPSTAPIPRSRQRSTRLSEVAAHLPTGDRMRTVATLGAGTLVGEIALLAEGEKRNATVRAAEGCELLVLDRKSFRDLDRDTLQLISANAKYSVACAKAPAKRTPDDVDILKQRTPSLARRFNPTVHQAFCKSSAFLAIEAACFLVAAAGAHVEWARCLAWCSQCDTAR